MAFREEGPRRSADGHHALGELPRQPAFLEPGGASTGLQKHAFARSIKWFGQPAQAGALPSLRAATAPDVQGGDYYGPWLFLMRGAPIHAWIPPQARDEQTAARLWQRSEELTGVKFDLS